MAVPGRLHPTVLDVPQPSNREFEGIPLTQHEQNNDLQSVEKRALKWNFMDYIWPNHGFAGTLNQAGTTWYPKDRKKLLGHGSEGMVQLWYSLDHNNNIVDRVVVKECVPGASRFLRPEKWHNQVVGGTPMEVHLAQLVEQQLAGLGTGAAAEHIVQCRGFGDVRGIVHPALSGLYKIYYEYCEYGDFVDVMGTQSEGIPGRRRGVLFPESFLWYMFEALAKVALAMEQVGVVHGDMQAGNILFAANDTDYFRIHPIPKVHDFGSAQQGGPNQPLIRNATFRFDNQCQEYTPPELTRNTTLHRWSIPNPAWGGVRRWTHIRTRANIWQIGLLMLCAMRGEAPIQEKNYASNGQRLPRNQWMNFEPGCSTLPMTWQHANANYSPRLIQLVQWCMSFLPNSRPPALLLLRQIQAGMLQGRVNGMDDYDPVRIPPNHPERLLACKANKYKVGKKGKRTRRLPTGYIPPFTEDSDIENM